MPRGVLPGGFFYPPVFSKFTRKGGRSIVARGKVKWFNNQKGYGFITTEDGKDVFLHHSALSGEGFKTIEQGQEVEFDVNVGPKGEQAVNVVKV